MDNKETNSLLFQNLLTFNVSEIEMQMGYVTLNYNSMEYWNYGCVTLREASATVERSPQSRLITRSLDMTFLIPVSQSRILMCTYLNA